MNIAISISAAILLISPTILLGAFLSETKTSAELVKCSDYYHDLMSNQDARIISKTGDVIYLKVPNNTKTIELNEEKRKSRIAQEIITIIEAIKPGVSIKADEIKECVMYMQKYKRSNLHVSAKNSGDKELSSKTLILGPKENWYLSVDMPVTDINQLTYDQTTNSVVEKEKPSSFYLGINYQFGDVLIDYDDKKFTDNLSLKFMAKASSPSES